MKHRPLPQKKAQNNELNPCIAFSGKKTMQATPTQPLPVKIRYHVKDSSIDANMHITHFRHKSKSTRGIWGICPKVRNLWSYAYLMSHCDKMPYKADSATWWENRGFAQKFVGHIPNLSNFMRRCPAFELASWWLSLFYKAEPLNTSTQAAICLLYKKNDLTLYCPKKRQVKEASIHQMRQRSDASDSTCRAYRILAKVLKAYWSSLLIKFSSHFHIIFYGSKNGLFHTWNRNSET
jgi:hypothetical protein